MMIKKMTAGLMAGVLMLGSLSATCYAASAENISESDPALIAEDHADVSKNAAASKATAGTSAEAENTKKSDAGTTAAENTDTEKSDTETTDTEPPEAEMLPYDVSVDEDGNYTFTFGDWEWFTKDTESDGTDEAINDKVKSYLIIDRNEKGEENVHFLNMVDEADLFALMDEDQVAEYQAAHGTASTEDTESEASTEDTSADAVQDNASEPEVTKKKSLNVLPLVGVLIILGACGGSYFYLQAKKKKAAEQKPDPDADYTDEDEEEYLILEDDDDANEEDNDPNDGEYESEAEDMEASETTEE